MLACFSPGLVKKPGDGNDLGFTISIGRLELSQEANIVFREHA